MWNEKELDSFEINLKEVDRIYHVHNESLLWGLMARVNRNGHYLYTQLLAHYIEDPYSHGLIFVSTDANFFAQLISTTKDYKLRANYWKNVILEKPNEHYTIYQSLWEDVQSDEQQDIYKMFRKVPPTLEYLCHKTVYENEFRLQPNNLPKMLEESVYDFIKFEKMKQNFIILYREIMLGYLELFLICE